MCAINQNIEYCILAFLTISYIWTLRGG